MRYTAPTQGELPPIFLTTCHSQGGGAGFSVAGPPVPTSGTWSATNRIIYCPFTLTVGRVVYRLFWLNGATVGTNNLQMGVYDKDFNRVINGTSTLSAGANVCQFDNITDTYLGPGQYYLALWCNGTTATVFRMTNSGSYGIGFFYESNASGLPATGTPADTAAAVGAFIPVCGLALRATDP